MADSAPKQSRSKSLQLKQDRFRESPISVRPNETRRRRNTAQSRSEKDAKSTPGKPQNTLLRYAIVSKRIAWLLTAQNFNSAILGIALPPLRCLAMDFHNSPPSVLICDYCTNITDKISSIVSTSSDDHIHGRCISYIFCAVARIVRKEESFTDRRTSLSSNWARFLGLAEV